MLDKPLLDINNLSIDVGRRPIVQGVSIQVAPGEIVGLLGPNGAGKTTLLRAIYHGTRYAGGSIHLDGRDQRDYSRADWARNAGALVQGQGLLPGLTPADIVDIGLRPLGLSRADHARRLDHALAIVELSDKGNQPADSLSGGELQRCYFAQLLARDPQLYILDEPTNHLDLYAQLSLLDEVRRRGRTVLATFHDLAMAARYCTRVAVMEQGRIVAAGPTHQVLTRARLAQSYRVAGELTDGMLRLDGPL